MLEFLFEVLLPFALEVLADACGDVLFAPLRRASRPVHIGLFMLFAGAVAGGLSLLVAPHNMLQGGWRIANVALTPVAVAALVHVGVRLGKAPGAGPSLRQPVYAYLFALAVVLVRLGAS